ncbi:dTDP-D-glucose 4,6-dehydratase [Longilinea arvoryzae]|uniref:dTDP-D-glucose 4,6-dehydratase n=1 Tax=Longilinea arvoryzae TaxID=360412 RepID=A0A0S7BFQ3_9CHLR|nr:SDR family NAD(P)-dependent oxidoreductase [Longilinea arvoryzae]GAP14413.1 dTDP-D-glucose 4,6-dehydratase [Longilinea arvoryzae]
MSRNVLITGGAGFIGSNYAARCIARGDKVTIFDNLSRSGAATNLEWLKTIYGSDSFRMVLGDVRKETEINAAAKDADIIVHLAAQVAVTTSVTKPREDFEINAQGTFNVLEAARASSRNPAVLYTSTNKVYGGMEDVRVEETPTDYRYTDFPLGIPESQPLDFHSPYGCSKGCGDQYVRDYHRIYGLPTVVLRQSCIYGTRQFGVEDQGWVAWFIIAAVTGRPITIYGDGKQVRDVLFVEDVMNAYDAALSNLSVAAGQVYNIGGGPANTMSVWTEFEPILERLLGRPVPTSQGDWRPGDQRIYVSDIRKAQRDLNWIPRVGVAEGVERLYRWVVENRNLF